MIVRPFQFALSLLGIVVFGVLTALTFGGLNFGIGFIALFMGIISACSLGFAIDPDGTAEPRTVYGSPVNPSQPDADKDSTHPQ